MTYSLLVFTRTTGYRHDSIPAGVRMLRELGGEGGFTATHTEDPGDFTDRNLARYRAVVWLNTSGDVLTEPGRAAFARYVAAGGGYAGVHNAANAEPGSPFYGELLGARFARHPPLQPGTVLVEDAAHPSTAHLPARWTLTDEWYEFTGDPREHARVLARTDSPLDRPLVWCHERLGGRAWYTALGHTSDCYADPLFRAHVLGGLRHVAG